MFALLVSFSLLSETWKYSWASDSSKDTNKPVSRPNRGRHDRSQGDTADGKRTRKPKQSSRRLQQAAQRGSRGPLPGDGGFTLLSPEAQESQRLAYTQQLSVETALAREIVRKDRESLGVLEAAHVKAAARLRKERGDERRPAVAAGDVIPASASEESWSVVGSLSGGADFCRVLDLDGMEAVGNAEPSPTKTAPPTSRLKARIESHRLLEHDTAERSLSSTTVAPVQQYDYTAYSLGSQLVEGGKEREDRLRDALREFKRRQAESLHELFDSVRTKDEEFARIHAHEASLVEDPASSSRVGRASTSDGGFGAETMGVQIDVGEASQEAAQNGHAAGAAGWEQGEDEGDLIIDVSPMSVLSIEEEDDWFVI